MSIEKIPHTDSIQELARFWDTHDLAEYWEQTHPVEFEVDIQSEVTISVNLRENGPQIYADFVT